MRSVLVIAAVVAATAASIPAATAATKAETPCVRHDLPVPAGTVRAVVHASDPTGRFQLGQWQPASGGARTVVWRNGVPRDLGPLAAEDTVALISTRGELVGGTSEIGAVPFAWRQLNGVRTPLPTPAGAADIVTTGINARGEIAGSYAVEFLGPNRAIVWRPNDTYRVLPLPEGFTSARSSGIDDDGLVAGTVANDVESRGIVWRRDGTWRLLPPEGASSTNVYDLRHGVVAGQVDGAPALWTVSSGTLTQLQGEGYLGHVNARRSSVGAVDGRDVLVRRSGELRPIPASTDQGINVTDLDDQDNVFGWDWGSSTVPVRWSCR